MHAYISLAVFVSGVPFSLAVRWSWGGGWLNELDPPFHDFAGSAVVHVVGGVAALAGVGMVGPRSGRYGSGLRHDFMPHDVGSVLSGVLILWVGWYGFNSGSTNGLTSAQDVFAASNAAITTTMAAAAAAVSSLTFCESPSVDKPALVRCHQLAVSTVPLSCPVCAALVQANLAKEKLTVDAIAIANSILAGLVAITAGSDVIRPDLSLIIGVGGTIAYHAGSQFLDFFKLDDVRTLCCQHCERDGPRASLVPVRVASDGTPRPVLARARVLARHALSPKRGVCLSLGRLSRRSRCTVSLAYGGLSPSEYSIPQRGF